RMRGGQLALDFKRDGRDSRIDGRLRAEQSHLAWGDFSARGELTATVELERSKLDRGAGSIVLASAELESGKSDKGGWAARARRIVLGYSFERDSKRLNAELNLGALGARGRIGATAIAADLETRLSLTRGGGKGQSLHGAGDLRISNASLSAG